MESLFFYIFAVASVVGAILVVSHKNPIASGIALVLTLFSTAALFVLLLAHFIAAVQVLVYAGAIMVLFMFTVMFLNLREDALEFDTRNMPLKLGVLFIILAVFGYFASGAFRKGIGMVQSGAVPSINEDFGTVQGVGELLFSSFILPFELTSVLILVAIIGVVVIAKRRLD
ncbi:MAG: NADH-quinone oxidoreductase subunit J family protein [Deltaproteobacteria bacterium]